MEQPMSLEVWLIPFALHSGSTLQLRMLINKMVLNQKMKKPNRWKWETNQSEDPLGDISRAQNLVDEAGRAISS